jgi:hypothetical protein
MSDSCIVGRHEVDLTLQKLCADLNFKPQTFLDVTGVAVPAPKVKLTEVIPFKQFA